MHRHVDLLKVVFIKGVDHSKKVCPNFILICSTEVNLEVVEVLMFLAGS